MQQKEHEYFSVCDFGSTTTAKLLKSQNKKLAPDSIVSKQKSQNPTPNLRPSLLQEIKDYIEETARKAGLLVTN
jgi:hypothetical protein